MAHRVVRRMLTLLLLLDDRADGLSLDEVCRQVGYTSVDEDSVWARTDDWADPESGSGEEREAHRRVRERASKALREDVERLRQLGFHIREDRRSSPGDLDYHVRLTLEDRPFVPVTLNLEDVASVVEWAAWLQHLPTEATGLPRSAIEFGRAAETGVVVRVDRGERSWTIHPWQVVIRGDRAYGVGRDLATESVRTLRLDTADTRVVPMDECLGPASDESLDIPRMVDPLTWGEHHTKVRLITLLEHVPSVKASLHPAVVDIEPSSGTDSVIVTLNVSDLDVAAERIIPLMDKVTVDSVELQGHLHRIADQLEAEATWLPSRTVVPPMAAPVPREPQAWVDEPLAPPGPAAPEGRRDSTSDTGALLLALNFLEETGGTPSIHELSKASARSPREITRLLATYLDLWLDVNDESSASPAFTLLNQVGDVVLAEAALQRPQEVVSVRWEAAALADIGRTSMQWQTLCGLLIRALAVRDLGLATDNLWGSTDAFIADLERRLGLDAEQLTVLQEADRSPADLEVLTHQWRDWSRNHAVVRLAFHESTAGAIREVDVQPLGVTEDGRLVGIDPHRRGSPPENRIIAVPSELVDTVEQETSTRGETGLTEVDRIKAIEAAGLTRLVTLAVQADTDQTAGAVSTLNRLWHADIIRADLSYVVMLRIPLPVEHVVTLLLIEHPGVLRVVAPRDLVDMPRQLAASIRASLAGNAHAG